MLHCWVESSMRKVFRDATPGTAQAINVCAARNEREDVQVILLSDRRVRGVALEVTALKGPGQARIPASRVRTNFVAYVPVAYNTYNTEESELVRKAPDLFPDGLLEEEAITLQPGQAQPVWLTAHVPAETPPGEYFGEVRVAAGKEQTVLPLRLTVWPFDLSTKGRLWMTNWFSPQHLCDRLGAEMYSPLFWQLLDRVAHNMAEHRQNVILTPIWSLVKITRTRSGYGYNYSRLDRWIRTFDRYGVAELIEGSHLGGRLGDWDSDFGYNPLTVFDAAGRPELLPAAPVGDPEREALLRDFLLNLEVHLKQRGWYHRLILHVADEPVVANAKSYERMAAFVRSVLPGVRRIDAVMSHGLRGSVEIRVPQIQELSDEKRPRGEELWFYTCLAPQGPYPNRFVDFSLLKVRIMHWLNWRYGATGYLHWGYNWWGQWSGAPGRIDPWQNTTGGSEALPEGKLKLPPGDPFIVYPGTDGVCNSLRWEMVRRGVEDYEYLWLLEQKAAALPPRSPARRRISQLLQCIRGTLLKSHSEYTRSESELLAAREAMAALLA